MGMEIVVSMGTPMSAYYPIVVAMEAGHARCLMRKPESAFDPSTAQAIKELGANRFNLDVTADRGATRKVPMSVPSLHCPIPQLSTTHPASRAQRVSPAPPSLDGVPRPPYPAAGPRNVGRSGWAVARDAVERVRVCNLCAPEQAGHVSSLVLHAGSIHEGF